MKFLRTLIDAGSLALATFIFVNLFGDLLKSGFSADYFWILPVTSPGAGWSILKLGLALFLIFRVFIHKQPRIMVFSGTIMFGFFSIVALTNAFQFFRLLFAGAIRTPSIIPFSFLVVLLLAANMYLSFRSDWGKAEEKEPVYRKLARWAIAGGIVAGLIPLGIILTMGPTDYSRKADAAIILGAKAYADGTPSLVLDDRVKTGIRLYKKGLVSRLIMTGGTGREGISEPQVMRRLAMEAGIPEEDIICDETGVNTAASARNCLELMKRNGFKSALAVSHYYHTPRIKMLFKRAGIRCYVVPARMTRRPAREPYYVFRECAAIYYHYLLTW